MKWIRMIQCRPRYKCLWHSHEMGIDRQIFIESTKMLTKYLLPCHNCVQVNMNKADKYNYISVTNAHTNIQNIQL